MGYIGSLISIEALGQSRVREKIIYILRYLLQRYGEEDKDGWWRLNVRITQTDISNLIGITRETVAVELKKLKQEGIIHTGSFSYSLNMKKLIELTNIEDWKEFI
ncbi:MAG: helix-turn-helix domain-containing protein [Acidimicrobiia bacterium]